mgnify:FL=1
MYNKVWHAAIMEIRIIFSIFAQLKSKREKWQKREELPVSRSYQTKPVDEYGHLQPQAPELEEAVLGALMIEKDAYSLVSEILRPESFYEHRNQLIYAAITDLAIQQKPIDILTVTEQLRSRGDLDEVGGPFISLS